MQANRSRQIIEIAGVVAVVTSLLLVAYQILQANRLAEASTLYEIVRDINQFNDIVLTNPSVAELLAELEDPDFVPTVAQGRRLQALADRMLNVWVVQEVAYRNGLLDDVQLAITQEDVTNSMEEFPALIPYWQKTLGGGTPALSNYLVVEPLLK